jgi:hypothetical protein
LLLFFSVHQKKGKVPYLIQGTVHSDCKVMVEAWDTNSELSSVDCIILLGGAAGSELLPRKN